MFQIQMLPAREGDALWIRWGDKPTYQMMVDMGTEKTGRQLRARLEALPAAARKFELLVITHIDRDHIGGVLTCVAEAEPLEGLEFEHIWFNGWRHLDGHTIKARENVESMGPAQGERLTSWLHKKNWNEQFATGPVQRLPDSAPPTFPLPGGLNLTILGPTPARLTELKPVWKDEVHKALIKKKLRQVSPGLEIYGSENPPKLDSDQAINVVAESDNKVDDSEANGSSIALLLNYKDHDPLLLAADAYSEDLEQALQELSPNGQRIRLSAVKLPHHGSAKNIMDSFIKSVESPLWLFSTDGNRFKHPDAAAVARVIRSAKARPPKLCFNVPSKYNLWWNSEDWQKRFKYETEYGTAEDGLTVTL